MFLAVARDFETGSARVIGYVGKVPECGAQFRGRYPRRNRRWLGRPFADQAVCFEFAKCLPHCDKADAEPARNIRFLRQRGSDRVDSSNNRCTKNIGELSIQGTIITKKLLHWKGIEADVYLSHDSIQDWPRIMLA